MTHLAKPIRGDGKWSDGPPVRVGWYWVCGSGSIGGFAVVYVTGVGSMLEWQAVCPLACDLSYQRHWPWSLHCPAELPHLTDHTIIQGES
ncbi:hypothetical protein HQ535_08960 [bacterium]|nr:hypothetical protein [bacterium]